MTLVEFPLQLALFDMRFPAMAPACNFEGHVNDVRTGLVSMWRERSPGRFADSRCLQGLAVAPGASHLFAAGADRRVRCWDIRSGVPVLGRGGGRSNPLLKQFDTPVTGLQMSEPGVLAVLHGPHLEVYGRGKLNSWAAVHT